LSIKEYNNDQETLQFNMSKITQETAASNSLILDGKSEVIGRKLIAFKKIDDELCTEKRLQEEEKAISLEQIEYFNIFIEEILSLTGIKNKEAAVQFLRELGKNDIKELDNRLAKMAYRRIRPETQVVTVIATILAFMSVFLHPIFWIFVLLSLPCMAGCHFEPIRIRGSLKKVLGNDYFPYHLLENNPQKET